LRAKFGESHPVKQRVSETMHLIVHLDTVRLKVHGKVTVKNHAVYFALGIRADCRK
jgi:transposase-like protein